jgi:hypothetical protein
MISVRSIDPTQGTGEYPGFGGLEVRGGKVDVKVSRLDLAIVEHQQH